MKPRFQTFFTLIMASCLLASTATAQQSDTALDRNLHLGFTYPISTNGLSAGQYRNGCSFHLLVGCSRAERWTTIAGIGNIIKQDANGLGIAGLFNTVGGNQRGVQIAGLSNRVRQQGQGLQLAGLINTNKEYAGLSIAGLTNIALQHSGLQLAGLFNQSKVSEGLQLAGLLNSATHAQHQIAGLINIADRVEGLQLAGLLNIATDSEYPIGLVNIIKNGERQLGLSIDDLGSGLISLRSGGRYTYGLLSLGINKHPEARYVLEAGIGMHFPLQPTFRLNAELSSSALTDFSNNIYQRATLKVLAEWQVFPGFSIFAGPSISYLGYLPGQKELGSNRYLWVERESQHYNGMMWGATTGLQVNL